MDLTLKDRVLILNNILPKYDTRANLILKLSIENKILLQKEEEKELTMKNLGNGQFEVTFKSLPVQTLSFSFTDEEMDYLKQRVDFIDKNAMFSSETLPTYEKIINFSPEKGEPNNNHKNI